MMQLDSFKQLYLKSDEHDYRPHVREIDMKRFRLIMRKKKENENLKIKFQNYWIREYEKHTAAMCCYYNSRSELENSYITVLFMEIEFSFVSYNSYAKNISMKVNLEYSRHYLNLIRSFESLINEFIRLVQKFNQPKMYGDNEHFSEFQYLDNMRIGTIQSVGL
jgi:hypothetical protein